MFSKLITFASMFAFAFAAPTPGSSPIPASQCNTGALQCCQTYQQAGTPGATELAGVLGIAADLLNSDFAMDCSPLTGGGIGSGATCAAVPVCCSDTSSSSASAGCVPVTLIG